MTRPNRPKDGLTRRTMMISIAAAVSVRSIPRLASTAPAKRVLTIVVDKATGAMRAIDRIVP